MKLKFIFMLILLEQVSFRTAGGVAPCVLSIARVEELRLRNSSYALVSGNLLPWNWTTDMSLFLCMHTLYVTPVMATVWTLYLYRSKENFVLQWTLKKYGTDQCLLRLHYTVLWSGWILIRLKGFRLARVHCTHCLCWQLGYCHFASEITWWAAYLPPWSLTLLLPPASEPILCGWSRPQKAFPILALSPIAVPSSLVSVLCCPMLSYYKNNRGQLHG